MSWLAAAVIGSAVVGGVASSSAARRAGRSADAATAAQSEIAQAQIELGREELDFTREQWAEMRPTREAMSERAIQTSDAQLAQMQQQTRIADEYDAYNRSTFRPLEQGLVSDATAYDTAGRRAEAVERATADVEGAAGRSIMGMNREILRRGGSLDDGGVRSVMGDMALGKARMVAGATDSAVRNVETQGYARRMDAANLGRGLPSAQATSAQIALNAGDRSNANMQTALTPQMQGVSMMQSGYGGASSAFGSAGNLYGQAARTYLDIMDSYNRVAQGAGQAAGQYAMMRWGK